MPKKRSSASVTISLAKEIKAELQEFALKEGRSVSNFLTTRLPPFLAHIEVAAGSSSKLKQPEKASGA
jgi:hypothetical protein